MVVPAWGRYTVSLPTAVSSCVGASEVIAVVDAEDAAMASAAGATLVLSRGGRDLASSRNWGALHATSEYVLFLDADDALVPTALSRMLAVAASGRYAAVGGVFRYSDGSGRSWPPPVRARASALLGPVGVALMLGKNALPSTAALIRRSLLPPEGLFPPGVHDEDWHAALHLLSRGRYCWLAEDVLSYTIDPVSRSRAEVSPSVEAERSRVRDAALLATVLEARGHPRLWRVVDRVMFWERSGRLSSWWAGLRRR